MRELLRKTGWKSTVVGTLFSVILIALESQGVDKLTIKDLLLSIEPLILSFLIKNDFF